MRYPKLVTIEQEGLRQKLQAASAAVAARAAALTEAEVDALIEQARQEAAATGQPA